MATFSKRLDAVQPSQTKAMAARAAALKAAGEDIIVLSLGEPDFDTPDNVRAAAIAAINNGHTHYTAVPGIVPLREAIAAKLKRENKINYPIADITVGGGAKQVLTNALFATLNDGDEVIFATPCWTSYPDMVRIAGGTPVPVDCSATGFKLTPEALAKAITKKTRWLMLNSPANPTGAVYSREELAALADVIRPYENCWVLSDDIYEHLVYEEGAFSTMAEAAPDLKDRVCTVNGVSKAHAMTGWRIGYGAGPSTLIKKMNLIQSQTTSHASSIAQHAAVEALDGPQTHLREFKSAFKERRDLVFEKLQGTHGFNLTEKPVGAFYFFINCADVIGATAPNGETIDTDTDLSNYLLEEAKVAVMPGSAFLASPFIRISYANSLKELEVACDRIVAACARLQLAHPRLKAAIAE